MNKPKLGNIVRDVTTGLTGTATSTCQHLSGSLQICVQPKLKADDQVAGAIPDALNIDIQNLEFVDSGVVDRVSPPEKTTIALGEQVEDTVTGFKGITTHRVTFINGCVYYHVQPKQTFRQKMTNELPKSEFLASGRLKKIGAGVTPNVAPECTTSSTPVTGGPNTKAMRP